MTTSEALTWPFTQPSLEPPTPTVVVVAVLVPPEPLLLVVPPELPVVPPVVPDLPPKLTPDLPPALVLLLEVRPPVASVVPISLLPPLEVAALVAEVPPLDGVPPVCMDWIDDVPPAATFPPTADPPPRGLLPVVPTAELPPVADVPPPVESFELSVHATAANATAATQRLVMCLMAGKRTLRFWQRGETVLSPYLATPNRLSRRANPKKMERGRCFRDLSSE
jgi:hypothetical protein